jgi:hypothetical protein
MNYMIGNTLNIFVIFFTFQNVYNPLKNLFVVDESNFFSLNIMIIS